MKAPGNRAAHDRRVHARMLRAAARRAGLTVAQLRGGSHRTRRNELDRKRKHKGKDSDQ